MNGAADHDPSYPAGRLAVLAEQIERGERVTTKIRCGATFAAAVHSADERRIIALYHWLGAEAEAA